MNDPSRIIAPSPEEIRSFNDACERAGRHFARRVRRVEIDLIYELLKRPPALNRPPAAAIDEADCFPGCALSQEEARDELQRIERSLGPADHDDL